MSITFEQAGGWRGKHPLHGGIFALTRHRCYSRGSALRLPWATILGIGALAGLLAAELFLRWRLNPATWAAAAGRLPASFQDLTWDAVQTRQRIVVLGDSIAVGVGVAPAAAWPAQLQQQLDIRQPGAWAVINASVPGETALQGLLRIERDVLRWRPHLALIAFGLNDGRLVGPSAADLWRRELLCRGYLQPGPLYLLSWLRGQLRQTACWAAAAYGLDLRRLPPTDYGQALRLTVQKLRQANPSTRIMLLTLTPSGPAQQVAGRDDWQRQQATAYQAYNARLRDLSLELGADLVDVSSPLQAAAPALVLQDDGLHLTIAGQAIVAAVVAGRIIGLTVGQ